MKAYKPTNKQGVRPNPRVHHHAQGLTCDCRQCGTEFTQYHEEHVYCGPACRWKHEGVEAVLQPCNDCHREMLAPKHDKGRVCQACKMLRINPERTDVSMDRPCRY